MISVAEDHRADVRTAGADVPAWATACLNCGAALSGPFCSQCGQNAAPPHPSVHELAHDALEQFAHWDGKVGATLRCLIARPGALTCDVLAGRRARYVSPLRLYLTCSVVYFLLSASAPSGAGNFNVSVQRPGGSSNVRVVGPGVQLTDQERAEALASVDKAPRLIRPLAHRALEDPRGLQRDMLATLPKVLFALLPVFAGILALFLSPAALRGAPLSPCICTPSCSSPCVGPLARFVRWQPLEIVVGVAVLLWIPVYAHLAFHRVYGSAHVATALKETGIGVLYALASIPAILIAAIWVGSHPH